MTSLSVPGGPSTVNSLVPLSEFTRGRCRVNSICGFFRSAPAVRCQTAMLSSIVTSPSSGRNFTLIYAAKARFLWASGSRSFIRCNAEFVQGDYQKQQYGSPSVDAQPVEKRGSISVVAEDAEKLAFRRSREDIRMRRKKFWQNFKEQHVVYKHDRQQWGLGTNPVFTVHEDEDGNRYQVDVNEEEILYRSGVDPNMTQFTNEDCKSLAEERIELAKAHARDIQLGLVTPSPLSFVYQYKRMSASSISNVGTGSWPRRSWSAPAGSLWQFLSLLVPLLSIASLGVGLKWLSSRRKRNEDKVVHQNKLRSMQMKKLNAQMSRELSRGAPASNLSTVRVNSVVNEEVLAEGKEVQSPKAGFGGRGEDGQLSVNDEKFQRKVNVIQAMARNAKFQEQERAGGRSAQSFEPTLEQDNWERRRVQGLESLAKDPEVFHRLGAESSDDPDPIPNAVKLIEEKHGHSSTLQTVSSGKDNYPSKKSGANSILRSEALPPSTQPKSPKSTLVQPRIILSAEEARALLATKRAGSKISSATSSSSDPGQSKVDFCQLHSKYRKAQPFPTEISNSTSSNRPRRSENSSRLFARDAFDVMSKLDAAFHSGSPAAGDASDCPPKAHHIISTDKASVVQKLSSENSENVNFNKQKRTRDEATRDDVRERGQEKSKDEKEEMEWMRDDVLRDIVFKVQANEEAGREPFYSLNSEQETLFFRGLERKFEREGDEVKKWIKDRVENIDYGSHGVSVFDPPESYELKWKEGTDRSPKSEVFDRFSQDRDRIMNEKKGLTYTSPPVSEEPSLSNSNEESHSLLSPAPSVPSFVAIPLAVSQTSLPTSKNSEGVHRMSTEKNSGEKKTKIVVSSSSRKGKTFGPHPSTSPRNTTSRARQENWDHTKQWAKDLERKYAMEKDPATRALMREIGQDLERWITEDEIEAASRMLDNGIEGEEEYVKMHYNRTMEKVKKQREMFGRDAMLNKYSEYREEIGEVELWWLSLPFVVCIGLRATVEGKLHTGLYSVDVAFVLDGVASLPSVPYHTVAFQDQRDAQHFCALLNSQPEKLRADGAEAVPFDPKELYKDAKSEGFKVTVIKKGQLCLSADTPLEEVESQILELCSARYFDELLSDRVIDMGSVVDEGLGFGQRPQP